ncbi:CGNR zinc finger domain-containing protein [Rhodococcus sp. H29-C3]|uniref:CGNR zinc finger domain-containing protein n=1 Tax=Rhodococcus sp. H29-C3 TaxID=3046307 RepID=UPI0024BA3168|nr:CGNR zinc finger domain-containing protein [Rhodococcus sp. H29-C3]MDJ0362545.1 CGNR zinc finger domain-containing protein [Rhodococcus sp. H29-C3]
MVKEYARNPAPGALDDVRTLLNTCTISHDTRVPVDHLTEIASAPERWGAEFSGAFPRPAADELARLRALLDEIRRELGGHHPPGLQCWLDTHPVETYLHPESGTVRHRARNGSCAATVVAIVVDAVSDDQWRRLRACHGCERVFYDRSPNLSRVWCGMYANGPEGRACGTIAKVTAHRARQRPIR